jgi:hypothetical protein
MRNTKVIKSLIILMAAVAFPCCAHLGNGDRASRDQLIQRVTAYWNARIEDQVETAYSIEHPEARKNLPFHRYARTIALPQQAATGAIVKLLSFKILAVDLKEDQANVTVQQETQIIAPGIHSVLKLSTEEQWFRVQGEWYHQLKDPRDLGNTIIQLFQKHRE